VNATSENARASVQPSLLRSLRGVWLFAWKSRLSWRRAPGLLGGLAILPFLVYLTVSSPNSWKRQENLPLPNQSSQLWQFERRLGRNNSSLTQEQRDQLKTIIQTEYDRVQSDWRDLKSPETSVDQQRVIIGNYFDGVLAHAKSVLDDDQFVVFRIWNRESLARRP
jgi:hypothetical protein